MPESPSPKPRPLFPCCGKRYLFLSQALNHLARYHLEDYDARHEAMIEALCPEAVPRHRPPYVREVCTCGAGLPECRACVRWKAHFGTVDISDEAMRQEGKERLVLDQDLEDIADLADLEDLAPRPRHSSMYLNRRAHQALRGLAQALGTSLLKTVEAAVHFAGACLFDDAYPYDPALLDEPEGPYSPRQVSVTVHLLPATNAYAALLKRSLGQNQSQVLRTALRMAMAHVAKEGSLPCTISESLAQKP